MSLHRLVDGPASLPVASTRVKYALFSWTCMKRNEELRLDFPSLKAHARSSILGKGIGKSFNPNFSMFLFHVLFLWKKYSIPNEL